MNKHVIITVKDITQNIYPVIVQKKSENRVMDIAEQLIIENLAKYSSNGNRKYFQTNTCMLSAMYSICFLKHSIAKQKLVASTRKWHFNFHLSLSLVE